MASIEYFYAGYSGFAYLGSRRFMEIAKAAGREVRHRPFDLRHLLDHNGSQPFDQRSNDHLPISSVARLSVGPNIEMRR